ncbi:hypothetical protein LZK75_11475 [Rhizobium leguminosarum]|nr:hypothetical protein LZK75_11475 [Rhizobium leguminosarum]
MAATYHVRKVAKGRWAVTSVIPGWTTPIGTFTKRSAAITTARLPGRLEVGCRRPLMRNQL